MMHWLAAFLILIQLALPGATSASGHAATQTGFVDAQHDYVFGEKIHFSVRVEAGAPLRGVIVYITPQGQPTVWQEMVVNEAGQASLDVDVRRLPLLPFSTVKYRFEALFAEGPSQVSQEYAFQYEDRRFTWQMLEDEQFKVYWYQGDGTLGQEILNIAQRGLQEAQRFLDAGLPGQLSIYAYASSGELQTALGAAAQSWTAGHATPEMNMILISVPSGLEQKLELERQVPHEIMHILQYQVMGNAYTQQPAWLIEGMASLAELYPNPEYQRVLQANASADTLLPMVSLCAPFPRDAATYFQAYAQSESFARFLNEKYGKPGLAKLIEQYTNGLGCEEGVSSGLGISLAQAELRWKQEYLGIGAGGLLLRNLSPLLLVGLLILIPAVIAFLPVKARK